MAKAAEVRNDLIRTLPRALQAHAELRGGETAFADARRRVTYEELRSRTARLAGRLAELGVRRGDRVALFMSNRVEWAESWLAVLRAGAVGVALDPGAADAELGHFLDDCGAAAVITEEALLPRVTRLTAERPPLRVVVVTGADAGAGVQVPAGAVAFEELVRAEPALPPRDDLGLDEPAWIHYTSGTATAPGPRETQMTA